MTDKAKTYDVFLSFSLADAGVADLAAQALTKAGLDVFRSDAVQPGSKLSDAVWQALAESAAVVMIIDPDEPPAATPAVELGAAMAWHKPVFALRSKTSTARLPAYLSDFPTYPVSRVDDLVRSIMEQSEALSPDEVATLGRVYEVLATPTDRLLRQPAVVDQLARSFAKASGRHVSGERLMRELIRLRKQGGLPRVRKSRRRANLEPA